MFRCGCLLWLLAGTACQALPEGNASPAPANVCGELGAACARYPADAGVVCQATDTTPACQVNEIAPYVLVVSVPVAGTFPEGVTYAISSTDLYAHTEVNVCPLFPEGSANLCFKLAPLEEAVGAYLVSPAQASEVGHPFSSAGTDSVSLPVAVTFWPQWAPPDTPTTRFSATDARLLNLPLPSVFAVVGPDVGNARFQVLVEAPDGSTAPLEWVADLPPSDSQPPYTGVVEVTSPLNHSYPGFTYAATLPSLPLEFGPTATFSTLPPATSNAKLSVQRADGEPFDGGWTAYYRDPATLLTLTSRVTLSGAPAVVQLSEISTQPIDISNAQFVIDPPLGTVMPQLVDIDVATEETYAAIPPIAHVSGQVQSSDGHAVSATLLFFSAGLDDVASCKQTPGVPPTSTLVYETSVATQDEISSGGTVGAFSIDLPQGRYGVVIQPTAASGYAKSTYEYLYVATPAHPVCSGPSPTIEGIVLTASDPVTVTGSAKTADGRPLANATVVFTPAAALAPGRLQPPTASFSIAQPEDLWPRPFTTTTGAAGAFSVNLDPYAQYDVTIQPQGGSNFPWVVRPNLYVFPGMLPIEPVVVPAPSFLDLTLESPLTTNNTPVYLAGAVVQAYAFYNGCVPPEECPVAVAIGDAITDVNGHLTMMLSTSFVGE